MVVVAVTAVVLLVVTGSATPAAAHTEVLSATPGPGEQVTAPVDAVELVFLDPVLPDVTIEVFDGTGDPVPELGPAEVSEDGRTATVSFAPLQSPGDHTVEYRFSATDGDVQRAAYQFEIRPPDDGRGRAGGALVAVLAVAGVVVAAVAIALRRRRAGGPDPESFA